MFEVQVYGNRIPKEVLEELLNNDINARKEWNLTFKLKNDPRITKIDGFLRRTSPDELPQLFNVLKGEMSFSWTKAYHYC